MSSNSTNFQYSLDQHAGKNWPSSVVIVRTEWNQAIVDELETGCHRVLVSSGIKQTYTLKVPGSVEIPFAIRKFWESQKYRDTKPDAFIALACVIKGDTPHFDHVCNMVSQGIMQLNLTLPVPTIFGVLTVLNEEQAWDRLGGKCGHKGEEAAITALSMIKMSREIKERTEPKMNDNLS